jgi:hypothetical protein
VYDQTGSPGELEMGATVGAGGMCGKRPCWKAVSYTGWSFRDRDGNSDGITKLSVKGGDAGQA